MIMVPAVLALFNLGIDNKLRGCDLVSLRVSDIARPAVMPSMRLTLAGA
jgi:hypothetical protein